jgi:GNAT superfamily N-acetyltransferase
VSDQANIRELRPDDRTRWNELWKGYLEFYRTQLHPRVTERTWQRLMDPQQPLHGLAAVDADDRLIGFTHYLFHLSTWSPTTYCYLEDLFVDPQGRGTGAGRALIKAVYSAADAANCTRVYWSTERSNPARALYDQLAAVTEFVQYRRP